MIGNLSEKSGADKGSKKVRYAGLMRSIFKRIGEYLADPESGCGKCGICHKVCRLMENKSSAKPQEE